MNHPTAASIKEVYYQMRYTIPIADSIMLMPGQVGQDVFNAVYSVRLEIDDSVNNPLLTYIFRLIEECF